MIGIQKPTACVSIISPSFVKLIFFGEHFDNSTMFLQMHVLSGLQYFINISVNTANA